MELARSAAEAELELARVRHLKVGLIQRIAAFADVSELSALQQARALGSSRKFLEHGLG
jgi:hypothetical protein